MWANFGTLLTVDTAFYQGDYHGDGNITGVIVNTARGNQGSYQETTWGAKQVANAKADGKQWGAYFFNGNLDPYTCGALFGHTLVSSGFDPAVNLVGIDCEDEPATGTVAWGPTQCQQFMAGVNTVISVPWSGVLVYMNYTVNRRSPAWADVAALGARLWYARPDGPLDQAYWPVVTMKQDGLYNGVDQDGHNLTYPQIIGAPAPKKRRSTDMLIFSVDDWGTGQIYTITDGYLHYVGSPAELDAALAVLFNSLEPGNVAHVKAASVPELLKSFHLEEFTVDQVMNLWQQNPATLVAVWRQGGVATIDPATIAEIKAAIPASLDITLNGKAVAA